MMLNSLEKRMSIYDVLLNNHLWPGNRKEIRKSPFIFQDDNATTHVSRQTSVWKEENWIPKFSWPSQLYWTCLALYKNQTIPWNGYSLFICTNPFKNTQCYDPNRLYSKVL